MLSRHAAPLLVLVFIAWLAAPPGPGLAAASPGRRLSICRQRGYAAVAAPGGGHYVVRNDNYGGRPECISNTGLRPNFTVTRSGADSYGSRRVMAYPFVLYGCSWGLCTPGSPLPAPVRAVRGATASWSFSARAPGRWNAAFDIWFGRHRSASRGQATGAELMIWLSARGLPPDRSASVRVGHRRWYLTHWVARLGRRRWNYVQLRAVRLVTHVRALSLLPIIARAERLGLIRRSWWMLNIESGFEIWHGGRGLATRSFSAAVRD
jgi:cellulose 1,4-beta-cellobiosidase